MTKLEDLPLVTLHGMYDAAMSAARSASAQEAALYRDGLGTPVERALAGEQRRTAWLRVRSIRDAISAVRQNGEAVQVKGELL